MLKDLKGGRIYSDWWRVLLAVAPELEAESDVQFPLACKVGVSGPHSGKQLGNQLYVILNRVGLYLTYSRCDETFPVLPCKGIEDRYRFPVQDE